MFKNKRKQLLVVVTAALLVLVLAGVVWAATTTKTATSLTDAQRKELVGLQKQILGIQKQIIQKQVEFKLLTSVEGKAREARLDVMAERMDNWDGTGPAFGRGFGRGGGRGRGGFGGGRGMAWKCPNCGATAGSQKTQ